MIPARITTGWYRLIQYVKVRLSRTGDCLGDVDWYKLIEHGGASGSRAGSERSDSDAALSLNFVLLVAPTSCMLDGGLKELGRVLLVTNVVYFRALS